jgi:tetratricopeptide (TPR) repeat protein
LGYVNDMTRWSLVAIAVAMVVACDRATDAQRAKPHAAAVGAEVPAEKIEKSLAAAQEYLNSQDVPKAQAILLTLIKRAPKEVRAYELYGQSHILGALQAEARGEMAVGKSLRKRAYEQYKRAVELDPHSAGLHQSTGQVALEAGDADGALRHFRTAAELDPRNPQHPLFAAQILIQQHQLVEARELLEQVLQLDPDEAYAHASLAMVALEQRRFDEAQQRITMARQIQPDDLGLRAQQAKVFRRSGEPRRALELLIGLAAAERATEQVTAELAAAYEQLEEFHTASASWQVCFRANPRSPRAWFAAVQAGEALLKAGDRQEALVWLKLAQSIQPDADEVRTLASQLAK